MKRMLCLILCLILTIPCAAAETTAMQACLSITGEYTFNIPEGYFHLNAERARQVRSGMTAEEIAESFSLPLQYAEELLMPESEPYFSTQDVCFAPEYPGAILFSLMPDCAISDIEAYSQQLAVSTAKHYVELGADSADCIDLGKLTIENSDIEWYGFTAPLDGISCFHFYGNYGADLMLITFNQLPESVVWPVLKSFKMVNAPENALTSWLDMLAVPEFTMDDAHTFESLYGRYSLSLPAGSTQYSLREMADRFGTGTASLRIKELDGFGIMSDSELHIESMTTPYTGLFRSDMEAQSEDIVASFTEQYIQYGYAESDLDIRFEYIGGRPFLSIHTADDPYDMGEYYTYSTTGTKYYFVFYHTTDAQEQAILETLRLDEPTYVAKDVTSLAARAKSFQQTDSQTKTRNFTSHYGAYTFDLPAGSYHYTKDEAAELLDTNKFAISLIQGEFYSIYNSDFPDLDTYVMPDSGGYTAEDMVTAPDDVIDHVLAVLQDELPDTENLACEMLTIGRYNFVRCEYTVPGSTMLRIEYYTYDAEGYEYSFFFYDTTFEEEFAILQTLKLRPDMEKADADAPADEPAKTGSSSRRADALKKLKSSSIQPADDRFEDVQRKTFTSRYDAYTLTLPENAFQLDADAVASSVNRSVADVEFYHWEGFSLPGSIYLNVETILSPSTPFKGDSWIADPEALYAFYNLNYGASGEDVNDYSNWSIVQAGENTFARHETPSDDGPTIYHYYTFDENGAELMIRFCDVNESLMDEVLASVQLLKLPQITYERFTSEALGYSIELPQGAEPHPAADINGCDLYRAFNPGYSDLFVDLQQNIGDTPDTAPDTEEAVMALYGDAFEGWGYTFHSIEFVDVGPHKAICISCSNSVIEDVRYYIIHSEQGNAYFFIFYDVDTHSERTALASLELSELPEPERDETPTPFTSLTERYTLTLPAYAEQATLADIADAYGIPLSSAKIAGYDMYSVFDASVYDVVSAVRLGSGTDRESFLADPQAVYDKETAELLKGESIADAADVTWCTVTVGEHTFACASYVSTSDTPIRKYYLFTDAGVEYCFIFYALTEAQEHSVLETLQLIEYESSGTALERSLPGSARDRLRQTAGKDDSKETDTAPQPMTRLAESAYYSMQIPAAMYPLSDIQTNILVDNAIGQYEDAGCDPSEFKNLLDVEIYANMLGNRFIEFQIAPIDEFSREDVAAHSEAIIADFNEDMQNTPYEYSDISYEFMTLGNNECFQYSAACNGNTVHGFRLIIGEEYELSIYFTGFTFEDACSHMETLILK